MEDDSKRMWWEGKNFIAYNGRAFEKVNGETGNIPKDTTKVSYMIKHAEEALGRKVTYGEKEYINKVAPNCRFFGVVHTLPNGETKLEYVG
jgi:UDP-3-O-acyl-N-acetylglucosamine deacetylase